MVTNLKCTEEVDAIRCQIRNKKGMRYGNHVMWVPVITALCMLWLQMEKMASRYEGYLWIYWISSHRQPADGCPPAWGLGKGLTTPHHKKKPVCYAALGLRNGWIPRNDLSNRKWIWDLEHEILGVSLGHVHWKLLQVNYWSVT